MIDLLTVATKIDCPSLSLAHLRIRIQVLNVAAKVSKSGNCQSWQVENSATKCVKVDKNMLQSRK